MKAFFYFLAGFAVFLLSHTLTVNLGFYTEAILYASALYLFFFNHPRLALPFLIGCTVANELLGTSHFGLATLLGLGILLLATLFAERVVLTAPFIRYCLALFFTLLLYSSLLFSLNGFLTRSAGLMLLFVLICLVSYGALRYSEQPTYELL